MPTLKAKAWALKITSEMGITFYSPSGKVPPELKKAIAQISKANVKPETAVKILKAKFSAAIVAVED